MSIFNLLISLNFEIEKFFEFEHSNVHLSEDFLKVSCFDFEVCTCITGGDAVSALLKQKMRIDLNRRKRSKMV